MVFLLRSPIFFNKACQTSYLYHNLRKNGNPFTNILIVVLIFSIITKTYSMFPNTYGNFQWSFYCLYITNVRWWLFLISHYDAVPLSSPDNDSIKLYHLPGFQQNTGLLESLLVMEPRNSLCCNYQLQQEIFVTCKHRIALYYKGQNKLGNKTNK